MFFPPYFVGPINAHSNWVFGAHSIQERHVVGVQGRRNGRVQDPSPSNGGTLDVPPLMAAATKANLCPWLPAQSGGDCTWPPGNASDSIQGRTVDGI